jgi:hypothetical protein
MPDQTPTDASDNPTRTGTFSRVKDLLRPSMTGLREFVRHPSHTAGKDSASQSRIQESSMAGQFTNAPPLTEIPPRSDKPESSPTARTLIQDPWGRSRLSQYSLVNVTPEEDHSNADIKPQNQTLPNNSDPDAITRLPRKPSYPAQSRG